MTKKMFLSVEDYIQSLDEIQKPIVIKLRDSIRKSLESDFEECIQYGMISYVVPKSIYPNGYHCDPKLALPFASLAAQSKSINIYHMGIYADPKLLNWFQLEYAKVCNHKLDMGKSCIRFKKYDEIPFTLISNLFSKISTQDWIRMYESEFK